MMKLYRKLEDWWFLTLPQKVRFVLVGGFNTVCSYLLFLFFLWHLDYQTALFLTYFTAINLSIFTMRYYVFKAFGNLWSHYAKAGLTYLVMIPLNYGFLYAYEHLFVGDVRFGQAVFTILSSIALYVLHKRVNFKR